MVEASGRRQEHPYPLLQEKTKWPLKPDVEHFESWPVRQPALLFAAHAFGEKKYLDLWKTLNPDPTDQEVQRQHGDHSAPALAGHACRCPTVKELTVKSANETVGVPPSGGKEHSHPRKRDTPTIFFLATQTTESIEKPSRYERPERRD